MRKWLINYYLTEYLGLERVIRTRAGCWNANKLIIPSWSDPLLFGVNKSTLHSRKWEGYYTVYLSRHYLTLVMVLAQEYNNERSSRTASQEKVYVLVLLDHAYKWKYLYLLPTITYYWKIWLQPDCLALVQIL